MPPEIYEHEPDQTLAVIVPIFNERPRLPTLLAELRELDVSQVILVDGRSKDGSYEYLLENWKRSDLGRELLRCPAGRATQMNVGSQLAHTDMLLFLHADTQLPRGAKREITVAREAQYFWGRFDVNFGSPEKLGFLMSVVATMINVRSRLTSIATGDQAIFVDHQVFKQIGGFREQPLMEDIELCKRLKKISVPHSSALQVTTSPRRWIQDGWWQTVLKMWWLRAAYFFGVSAKTLAGGYRPTR